MNCLTKLFQQKRRRIGYILAFSDQMISKRDSSEEESIRFLVKSLVVHQIFTKFAIGLVTGQGKVLAWSRYDAEKQDYLVDTSKLFSSVGWNLVNWNVERMRICLSESTPSYGVDSSFTFSFLRVLPEPNLQGSEESRGSHHLFSLKSHYELV